MHAVHAATFEMEDIHPDVKIDPGLLQKALLGACKSMSEAEPELTKWDTARCRCKMTMRVCTDRPYRRLLETETAERQSNKELIVGAKIDQAAQPCL